MKRFARPCPINAIYPSIDQLQQPTYLSISMQTYSISLERSKEYDFKFQGRNDERRGGNLVWS